MRPSDRLTRAYLNGPGVNEVLAVDQVFYEASGHHADTTWQFSDHLGTVRTTGRKVSVDDWELLHRNTDPAGVDAHFAGESTNLLGDTADAALLAAPILFAGHQYDTGINLYDMRARWYNPRTQHLLSEDPLGLAGGSANLYLYAGADPLNNIDPDGREVVTITLLGIAGAGLLYGAYQFDTAADEFTAEGDRFYGIANPTQGDITRYNEAQNSFASRVAAGSAGASLITLPFGGGVITVGALAGGVYGLTESYASGSATGEIAGNTAFYAGLGAVTGPALGAASPWLGRLTAPVVNRFSPHVLTVTGAVASRLPDPVRRQLLASVLDVTLESGIQRYASQTARIASQQALRRFVSAEGVVAPTGVQARAQALLDGAPGVNVTARVDSVRYQRNIAGGRAGAGTALTDVRAFEDALGPLTSGNRMVVTRQQAAALERFLGLPTGRLNGGGIISVVDDVASRAPRSPLGGNDLFLGGGRGLPGGGPEINVAPINTAGGGGIRQIILQVK